MFLKTLGPNGTRITVVSWKAGSRQGRSPYFEVLQFLAPAWAKRSSKGCLFENHENRKWHPNPTFQKSSALGPSKNGPQERFWKNMKNRWKNDRNINGFGWSKTIEKYWKTNTFLDFRSFKKRWQNDTKGDLKSHVLGSKMATWASQVRRIVWFLTFCCDAKKSSFLDAFPMDQQIEQIEPWSTKGPKKSVRGIARWCIFGQEGPRGRLARAD